MTHDHLSAPATALAARAECDADWHVYVNDPVQGPLSFCTGTGPMAPFAPDAAAWVLERDGRRVTGLWIPTPPTAEAQFTATVEETADA
ncbi:hypothetical protein [Streptomyces sp. NPDC048659]|uniref:hypothetical protein n=1 Tax=Streptomyces sp. NPDC048659 TaxID=3155489 RepID=UPI00341E2864